MTALTQTLSLGDRFAAFRAQLAERRMRSRIYRETMFELNQLSDRDLTDLGIARADLRKIAMDAANKA